MFLNDTYWTIKQISKGTYREKGSKFLATAIPVDSEFEVNERLKAIRKDYHDANHWCYAYRLGYNKLVYRLNDDGEPSGTAGKPIFGQILSKDLTNILVVVVRYFGGTKLGVSGLINAYKTATKDAIERADLIVKTINDVFTVGFEYASMNEVMRIMKEEEVVQLSHNFDSNCSIKFFIRKSRSELIVSKLKNINKLTINYIDTV
jgi:uncharacterized YigZ family protein